MKYYIYRVEKIKDFTNTAQTIDHDYTNDLKNTKI